MKEGSGLRNQTKNFRSFLFFLFLNNSFVGIEPVMFDNI